ncbi:MAG: helix-turn-helix transcriptional regulator [Actinomycetota bacterium]
MSRTDFESRDPAEAHEMIRAQHIGHRVRFHESTEDFLFRQLTLTAGPLIIDLQRHSISLDMFTDPLPVRYFGTVRSGQLQFCAAQDETRLLCGDGFTYARGVPLAFSWRRLDICVLRLPEPALGHAAAAMSGIEDAELRFSAMAGSPAMARYWRDTMAYLWCGFEGPDPIVASPLIQASVIELAAAAAIAVFPNTASTAAYVPGPGLLTSAAVRRAVAFIDANAGRPVTLADIAGAARLGARALQIGFRRQLGLTPTQYLRRVRLDHAHQELRTADPAAGSTVAAISRRWGWASPAQFAAAYRQAYGQTPGRTLRP